jgi:hypothetical protein
MSRQIAQSAHVHIARAASPWLASVPLAIGLIRSFSPAWPRSVATNGQHSFSIKYMIAPFDLDQCPMAQFH